jgi:hypothetical protein
MNTDENESVNASAVNAMMRSIESYRHESIHLSQLVNDLQSALHGMFQVPVEWRSRFLQSWAALEEVNALALDTGQSRLPADHEKVIIRSLEAIQQLIAQARSTFAR